MRKYLMFVTGAVLTMVVLCGCGVERVAIDPVGYKSVSQGAEITEEDAAQIVDGKTTKDEVYLMFGKPSSILEDGHVFAYNWIRGGRGNILGFGSGSEESHSLIVTFDDKDVVKGHKITRGDFVPGAATGN